MEDKKAIVALLAFTIVTLEIDTKGPFVGIVFKNPARIFCKMSSNDAKSQKNATSVRFIVQNIPVC